MAAGGHFGCPRLTFDHISGHFRSMRDFFIFYKMATGAHFGCPKLTFDRNSGHFRSIRNFFFLIFDKMAAVGHFGCPKFTLDCISGHFRSIRIFFLIFFSKWPPATILDGTTMSIIEHIRDIWMSNACVKFEEGSLNPSKVIALTTKLCGGGRRAADTAPAAAALLTKT